MAKAFLIQDPYHDYAVRFIEILSGKYGHRAVCFFTDRKRRVYAAGDYPTLRSEAVEASYDVVDGDRRAFATKAAAVHDIIAVVPHNEETVLSLTEMGQAIGLRWNDVEVMRRFRDKFAMKQHLRRVEPSLRMNASVLVRDTKDILEASKPFTRYVLKPNDGYGNRDVAIFDATTTPSEVAAFVGRVPSKTLLVEEFIDGREFFVNGQVDARGEIEVYAIFEYGRIAANGCGNLDYRASSVRTSDPVFGELSDYARRVIRASGLVRSPFHLEAKVDARGPCLVEAGARLAGLRNAFVCNAMHGGALDVFDVAAHYYLTDRDYGVLPLRWNVYDSADVRYVHGIARADAVCGDARSIAEVEGLRSFHAWAKKPSVGERADATVNTLTMPWSVVLLAPSGADLDADEARARAILERPRSLLSPRIAVERAKRLAERATKVLSWQLERLSSPVDDPSSAAQRGAMYWMVRRPLHPIARRHWRRKLQEAHIGRAYAERLELVTPDRSKVAAQMVDWARTYLGRPHEALGRSGPVCPFIAKTIASGGFLVAVHEEVERSEAQMRDIVLSHADSFQKRYPASQHDGSTSLLIVLPNVPHGALHVLDQIQDETKTYLMKRKIMVAAIHPESARPAIHNPSFSVLRAPVPCFALRHMVMPDIVFVGHNREAMRTYDRFFGRLFAQGKVSRELGYVDLYEAARARFGLRRA